MRILFSGTRHYIDGHKEQIATTLDQHDAKVDIIIHGDADGVDKTVDKIAREKGFAVESYPAEWGKYNPYGAAGPIRNEKMIKTGIDLVYCFPWPSLKKSRGTYDTYKRAKKRGIKTIVHLVDNTEKPKIIDLEDKKCPKEDQPQKM
jgi:hypothetical protein